MTNLSSEIRAVPGYEGLYSVTSSGEVWSHRSNKWLKPVLHNNGYRTVFLTRPAEKGTWFNIGCLVLLAFVGPCPPGQECLHTNDISTDDLLSNLRWGTHVENMGDKVRNGNAASRFSANDIREMRRLYAEGVSQPTIALKFNANQGFVSKVINRKVWAHVD